MIHSKNKHTTARWSCVHVETYRWRLTKYEPKREGAQAESKKKIQLAGWIHDHEAVFRFPDPVQYIVEYEYIYFSVFF